MAQPWASHRPIPATSTICRYPDRRPLLLQSDESHETSGAITLSSFVLLEDAIQRHVVVRQDDSENVDGEFTTNNNHNTMTTTTKHEEPAVDIRPRHDPHLLECRTGINRNGGCFGGGTHSILGIREDLAIHLSETDVPMQSCMADAQHQQERQVPLCMTVQHAVTVQQDECKDTQTAALANQDESCFCCCQAPHSDWERQSPRMQSHTESSSSSSPPPTTTPTTSSYLQLRWIDLRGTASPLSNQSSSLSQAATCHWLRSLLGTSHQASPWCASISSPQPLLPSVVVVVVTSSNDSSKEKESMTANSNPNPTALQGVRVGDVCPSYFLHATAKVHSLPREMHGGMNDWIMDTMSSGSGGEEKNTVHEDESMLMVFRIMPEREQFHTVVPPKCRHSSSGTTLSPGLPDGCLWETYQEQEENDPHGADLDDNDDEEQDSYRMTAPPYISHHQDYPNLLEPLLEHITVIREEALAIPQWTAWPEQQHYRSSNEQQHQQSNPIYPASWTVFPLCYCFPANVVENRTWIQATTAFVPNTTLLLQDILGDVLRTALFSRLDAATTLEAHTGWADLANHVYRVHIPLVVPEGGLCGTWVDGCVETHEAGRPLAFDDSKVHRAFNYSDSERVVLILDLARPAELPVGTATGGHTEELDKFIEQLS